MERVTLPEGLSTPSTIVLLDRLEQNLAEMASFAMSAGIALRPHAKTHKSPEIARRQLAHGAVGITVANIGEAEILASDVVNDVFIAYPLWVNDNSLVRLRSLSDRISVAVGADSSEAVKRLAPLAGKVRLLIEVDCGLRRSGAEPNAAPEVARAAMDAGLEVTGVFTFPGHSYAPGALAGAAADEAAALQEAAGALARAGVPVNVLSGGSTPSAKHSHTDVVNELRPGVYVFNDAQQVELGVAEMDDVALVVAATVVSKPETGRLVLDSGSKVLSTDRSPWANGHGRILEWPQARITRLWEHHAVVEPLSVSMA